jgi:hypothetical protein
MRARSSKQRPKHGVVPGPAAGRSPGTITPILSNQLTSREYGFRAPACGRPRNDGLRIVERDVIYAKDVIYEATSSLAYPGPRGAQRHRVDPGSSAKIAAQRLNIFS